MANTIESMRAMLDEAVAHTEAEVRNYMRALDASRQKLEMAKARREGFLAALELAPSKRPVSRSTTPSGVRARRRKLTGNWQRIMQRVQGKDFGYDDLMSAASMIGHEVGKETLRSQMSGF